MPRIKLTKTAKNLLAALDKAADPWYRAFPVLDDGTFPVDVRLSLYCDSRTWRLLIEDVQVDDELAGHDGLHNVTYRFAPRRKLAIGAGEDAYLRVTSDYKEPTSNLTRGRNGNL